VVAPGGEVSLSPLETVRAFDAPLLAEVDSNEEVEDVLREMRLVKVRYAAVGVENGD
jgi:hypothetical protein